MLTCCAHDSACHKSGEDGVLHVSLVPSNAAGHLHSVEERSQPPKAQPAPAGLSRKHIRPLALSTHAQCYPLL